MRLFLAVAVLMLALVAYTEAQEETIEQKLSNFGGQLTDFGQRMSEKLSTVAQDIKNSDTAKSFSEWWAKQMERIQAGSKK